MKAKSEEKERPADWCCESVTTEEIRFDSVFTFECGVTGVCV